MDHDQQKPNLRELQNSVENDKDIPHSLYCGEKYCSKVKYAPIGLFFFLKLVYQKSLTFSSRNKADDPMVKRFFKPISKLHFVVAFKFYLLRTEKILNKICYINTFVRL